MDSLRLDTPLSQIIERFPLLVDYFKEHEEVVVAYLFGSRARGEEDALSDIDMAVLLTEGLAKEEMWRLEDAMACEVSGLLETGEVDFWVLNTLSLSAKFEIISTGQILHSNDENRRTDFEIAVMNEYWDFKKYMEEYDRYLLRRIKESFSDVEREQYLATIRKIE